MASYSKCFCSFRDSHFLDLKSGPSELTFHKKSNPLHLYVMCYFDTFKVYMPFSSGLNQQSVERFWHSNISRSFRSRVIAEQLGLEEEKDLNKCKVHGALPNRQPLSFSDPPPLPSSSSSYCWSVSKSLRISCFLSPVVRFLHIVHLACKYGVCWAGLRGIYMFFFFLKKNPVQVCLTSMETSLCSPCALVDFS